MIFQSVNLTFLKVKKTCLKYALMPKMNHKGEKIKKLTVKSIFYVQNGSKCKLFNFLF